MYIETIKIAILNQVLGELKPVFLCLYVGGNESQPESQEDPREVLKKTLEFCLSR